MAISQFPVASSGGANGYPIGIKSVIKQGFSSTGLYTYGASLPAGKYTIACESATSNIGIFGNIGSTNLILGGKNLVVETTVPSASTTLLAVVGSPAPAAESTTFSTTTATYGAVSPDLTNHLWRYNGRIYFAGGLERGVFSIVDGASSGSARIDYIATTYSNQIYVGGACNNFATVWSSAAGNPASAAYTTDGNSWITFNSPILPKKLVSMGATQVAINSPNTTSYYTSTNGLTWTVRTAPVAYSSMAYDGTKLVMTPYSASQTWYQSVDGINWTTLPMTGWSQSGSYTWSQIEYSNGYWFASNTSTVFVCKNSFFSGQWTSVGSFAIPNAISMITWFDKMVFMSHTTVTPKISTIPLSAIVAGGTATATGYYTAPSRYLLGIIQDVNGALVDIQRNSSTPAQHFWCRSVVATSPAIFTIGTTDMEILN